MAQMSGACHDSERADPHAPELTEPALGRTTSAIFWGCRNLSDFVQQPLFSGPHLTDQPFALYVSSTSGQIAQLVEHRIENPGVESSILSLPIP